jgi:lipoprotein-releasing system ATP-binding protein
MMSQKDKELLRARDIKKSFYAPKKVDVIRGIDLVVNRGDTVAITGRSGQGKSTLLQLFGTLERPCSGSLEIAGLPVNFFTKNRLRNSHLAFVYQSFHLLDDYTALENVLMPARIARKNIGVGSVAAKRAIHLLERVGLADRINFHTKLLSGGEKQRVALARALCNDPDLILADEPSGNLDVETSQQIHKLLIDFVTEGQKGLIVVTHNTELAALCNKHYQLSDGHLHASQTSP